MRTGREALRAAFGLSRLTAPLGIMGLALLACGAPQASQPPPAGRIAFASSRDPAGVYVINADGSGLTFLGGQPAPGRGPLWSPDGTKLALEARIGYDLQIEVFNADGSNHVILQEGAHPEWSPDGERIAYVFNAGDNAEIYTVRPDGSDRMRLTTSPTGDWVPKWSPDGLRIAFVSVEEPASVESEEEAIEVVNADGTERRRIRTAQILGWPVWSPDGNWIAYVSKAGLQLLQPDGSGEVALAQNASGGHEPAWSPESSRIAYVCAGEWPNLLLEDICIADVEGQHFRRLTGDLPDGSRESHPSWSPDGEWIAFCASEPHFDIYVMASDGSSQTNLTNDSPADLAPAWMP